jgi:hypothetical protein
MRKLAKLGRENRMARAVDEAVRTRAQRDRRDVVPEKNSESIRDNCDVGRARQRSRGLGTKYCRPPIVGRCLVDRLDAGAVRLHFAPRAFPDRAGILLSTRVIAAGRKYGCNDHPRSRDQHRPLRIRSEFFSLAPSRRALIQATRRNSEQS